MPAFTGAAGVSLAATATTAGGWDVFEPLLTTTIATAVLTSVMVTAWPLLWPRGQARPLRRRKTAQLLPTPEDGSDGDSDSSLVYGAASVVSCIPFTNWVAWAGLALLSEGESSGKQQAPAQSRAGRYAAFAAVYSLPYLHCGLELDSLAVVSLLVGIAHMQLEFALLGSDGNGGGSSAGDDLPASISDWLSTWAQQPSNRLQQRRALGPPKARPAPVRRAAPGAADAEAAPRSASPTVARQLGERIGELTATLATLRTDFAAGKADGQLRTTLLVQEQDAQAELEALRCASGEDLRRWDEQYKLRTATRVQLLQLARRRGLVGASRLSKRELVDALEASLVVQGAALGEEGTADDGRRRAAE